MTPRPQLTTVTLVCIDTTNKVGLAERAIEKSLEQCAFAEVKLLTNDASRWHAVEIPPLNGIADYSRFCVQDLHRYVDTPHCLVVQSDGYALNAAGWKPEFLNYDYIGAPWEFSKSVGNGGFSLRSKRLLKTLALHPFGDDPHPEDNYICLRHRRELTDKFHMRFPNYALGARFAYEGRVWPKQGNDWVSSDKAWDGQFGFHSWLTKLPDTLDRPSIFHHSGDWGDVIYSCATMKALGGGVLFLSADNRYPFPRASRMKPDGNWAANIAGFLEMQDYVWRVQHTPHLPHSVDYDLNAFRKYYQTSNPDNWTSIWKLHLKAQGVDYPENKPWLTVDRPVEVPLRPIVINRTSRYHNDGFPWQRFVRKYQDKMAFVGTVTEAGEFQQTFQSRIPHIVTPTIADLARVIAGAKVFVGNQSTPLAIALGLGMNCVIEEWNANPNCRFTRHNAIYGKDSLVDIPKSWL